MYTHIFQRVSPDHQPEPEYKVTNPELGKVLDSNIKVATENKYAVKVT